MMQMFILIFIVLFFRFFSILHKYKAQDNAINPSFKGRLYASIVMTNWTLNQDVFIESARWISDVARGPVYYLILIGWGLWLWKLKADQQSTEPGSLRLATLYIWIHFWFVGFFWTAGSVLNSVLKLIFNIPRPWWLHSHIVPYSQSPSLSFGWPSGHAQSAWGIFLLVLCIRLLYTDFSLAGMHSLSNLKQSKKRRVNIKFFFAFFVSLIWIGCVGWSRVILHAHSWIQVFSGWIIGGMGVYIIQRWGIPSYHTFISNPTPSLIRWKVFMYAGIGISLISGLYFSFTSPHYQSHWVDRFITLHLSIHKIEHLSSLHSYLSFQDSSMSLFLWKPLLIFMIWTGLGSLILSMCSPKLEGD